MTTNSNGFIAVKNMRRSGSVVELVTSELEVQGLNPMPPVKCPWTRDFKHSKEMVNTQEAVAPSQHDRKIIDRDLRKKKKKKKKNNYGLNN